MTCNNARNQIVLFLYGELNEDEKQVLMKHIESCSPCRIQFQEISRLFKGLGKRKEIELTPRWEEYWVNILKKVRNDRSKTRFALPAFKWGFTLAGFALCLILGIFMGRVFFDAGNRFEKIESNAETGTQTFLCHYLEDMKPLMLDLSNSPDSGEQIGGVVVDRDIIRSMLTQTRLLRSRLSLWNDPHLNALLVDMELILIEVDNTVPGDRVMMRSVRDLIHQKDIPIKIDLFQQRAKQTRKI